MDGTERGLKIVRCGAVRCIRVCEAPLSASAVACVVPVLSCSQLPQASAGFRPSVSVHRLEQKTYPKSISSSITTFRMKLTLAFLALAAAALAAPVAQGTYGDYGMIRVLFPLSCSNSTPNPVTLILRVQCHSCPVRLLCSHISAAPHRPFLTLHQPPSNHLPGSYDNAPAAPPANGDYGSYGAFPPSPSLPPPQTRY